MVTLTAHDVTAGLLSIGMLLEVARVAGALGARGVGPSLLGEPPVPSRRGRAESDHHHPIAEEPIR